MCVCVGARGVWKTTTSVSAVKIRPAAQIVALYPPTEFKPTPFADATWWAASAITGDYALVKCLRADRMGNLTYSKSARNFAPIMCMAAKCAVVQTVELVEPGAIDPETVVTPGIFTGRIVHTPDAVQEQVLFEQGARYPCPPQPTPPQPPSRRRSA